MLLYYLLTIIFVFLLAKRYKFNKNLDQQINCFYQHIDGDFLIDLVSTLKEAFEDKLENEINFIEN